MVELRATRKLAVALFAVILVNQAPPASCRQRLEPLSKILHGGGQDGDAFFSYSAFMGSLGPSFYMTYCGLGGFNSTSPGQIPIYFQNLAGSLSKAAGTDNAFIIPQIGLQLPLNGEEADVGRGLYDNAIIVLRDSLVWLNRPVLLRIGYEFNGPWNNYTAAGYRGAYNRIASMLRASPALNETVAFIWDGSCDTAVDPTPFWPGAAYVDWIGVNIFTGGSSPVAPQDSCVWHFLTDAKQNGYPVILGEVTPRGYFTANASTWDAWFVPFLRLLAAWGDSPVKAVSYIDKDWEAEARWKGWGDSRIEVGTQTLQDAWRTEFGQSKYANRASRADMLRLLGLGGSAAASQHDQASSSTHEHHNSEALAT